MRTIHVIGIGCHPDQLTPQARTALESCAYVIAATKGDDDAFLAYRAALCEASGVELIAVQDPERDRSPHEVLQSYGSAVRDWHQARVDAYAAVLAERPGDVGFLVWGDPSLYDSTIRVVEGLGVDYRVYPGVSAPQLLAAQHRIVLHEVGQPVLITTQRRLHEAIDAGADNIVVMLTSTFAESGIEDWQIWWGANLGAPSEQLVAGRVAEVADQIRAARETAKADAGWVMDLFLIRKPA